MGDIERKRRMTIRKTRQYLLKSIKFKIGLILPTPFALKSGEEM